MEYSIKLVDQFLDELEKIVYVAHIYIMVAETI